jgi:hypothetical protein
MARSWLFFLLYKRECVLFEWKRRANIEHFQKCGAGNERAAGCSPASGFLW